MRGAGGTDGGVGKFILGLVMFIAGGYIFLESVHVHSGFHWGGTLFNMGGYGVTSGMILVPFMLGTGIIFYNSKNPIGWLLAGGALVAVVFGLIANVQFRFSHMSLFSLLTILVLLVGGAGLLLSGLRNPGVAEGRQALREDRRADEIEDRARERLRERLAERSRRR